MGGSSVVPGDRPLRGLAVFLPAYVLLVLLGGLWALATPVFASPDEEAHAIKAIAAVRGDLLGHREPGARFPVYDLPPGDRFPNQMMCFAFNPAQSADCGVEFGSPSGSSTFADWVSTYNPVYYLVVGLPSFAWTGPAVVYAMRMVSVLVTSLFLAAAFLVGLSGRRRGWMPAALSFLGAPMISFFTGSVNPQALEFSAAVLFAVGLLRLGERAKDPAPGTTGLPAPLLWGLTAAGGVGLALARATGPLWVVVVAALVFTAVGWRTGLGLFRRPLHLIPIGLIVIGMVFSAAWTLFTGTLGGQAEQGDAPLVGGGPLAGAWAMLRATPFFLQSAVGVFGWQDTDLPALAYGIEIGALLLLLLLAVVAPRGRARVTIIVAMAAALLVPIIVQSASVSRTGIIWQGRYGLFLYLTLLVLAGWVLSGSVPRAAWLRAPVTVVIAAIGWLFGVAAFLVVLRRYVVGKGTIQAMLHAPQWQPPLGWLALTVMAAVVLAAFAVWIALPVVLDARREGARELRPADG